MAKAFSGEWTYVDVAKELGVTPEEAFACFSEHWSVEADGEKVTMKAVKEAETVDDFIVLLKKTLKKFIKRLDTAMDLPTTAFNESAVTRLSAGLRAIMRDILEFDGKLKATPLVQLNIMQVQMTKLTSFMFSELCETDRQKLLKILPELQEAKKVLTT